MKKLCIRSQQKLCTSVQYRSFAPVYSTHALLQGTQYKVLPLVNGPEAFASSTLHAKSFTLVYSTGAFLSMYRAEVTPSVQHGNFAPVSYSTAALHKCTAQNLCTCDSYSAVSLNSCSVHGKAQALHTSTYSRNHL